jgi:hypothetical protein
VQYKVLIRDAAQALSEDKLNALGKDGWEFAAMLPHVGAADFYFQRMKD